MDGGTPKVCSLENNWGRLTISNACSMSRKILRPPTTLCRLIPWALLKGVDRWAARRFLVWQQCCATLKSASCVERMGRYDQIGQAVSSGIMAVCALEAKIAITALPKGSCSAKGRKALGCTGGLFGFGIRNIQLSLNHDGIKHDEPNHQSERMEWSAGAIMGAIDFHAMPGAHGRATAFPTGMALRAISNSSTVNGNPVRVLAGKGKWLGPCHVSLMNYLNMAASSIGLAMCPCGLRSCILGLGCLRENLLIIWKRACESWRDAAAVALSVTSMNLSCRTCLAWDWACLFRHWNLAACHHAVNRCARVTFWICNNALRCCHLFMMMSVATGSCLVCLACLGKNWWKWVQTISCMSGMSSSSEASLGSCGAAQIGQLGPQRQSIDQIQCERQSWLVSSVMC